MGLYPIILLLLFWNPTRSEDNDNLSIETLLDQVAIPTKIINDFFQKSGKPSKSSDASSNQLETSTVYYENSNGFVPLIVSKKSIQNKRNLTSKTSELRNGKSNSQESDSISSSKEPTSIESLNSKKNRRSFRVHDNLEEFEILKVNNGTPAVAKYNTFYDQHKNDSNTSSSQTSKKSLRIKDRDRGKRIQTYLGMYGTVNNDKDQQHQKNENENEKKLLNHHNLKQNNHKVEDAVIQYPENPVVPKASYIVSTTVRTLLNHYDVSEKSNENTKFNTPIMVQPSETKVDLKVSAQNFAQPTVVSNSSETQGFDKNDQSTKIQSNSRHYESADSTDFSGENFDYLEESERPRRVQKTTKRRPYRFQSSKKLPKEHRESYDDTSEDQGKKYSNSKVKSGYHQKLKVSQYINEDDVYDSSSSNMDENVSSSNNRGNHGNSWNQLTPNVEVSHSNGFELNQIEKPKIHIVPVNIFHSFDHATALDNSQGFDITNAMFRGFVPDRPLVSTVSPLSSSSSSNVNGRLTSSSTKKPSLRVSTPVPDVIVGQNSYQNPVQAVLLPEKFQQNMLNQFVQSTMAPPVFAVTSQPTFLSSSTFSPTFQRLLNQVQAVYPTSQNVALSQPSRFMNSKEHQDKNSNYLPYTQSTTSRSSYRAGTYNKKNNNGNDGEFLASASLSVSQGKHRASSKKENRYSKKNNNNSNDYTNFNQYDNINNHDSVSHNLNTFVQPTIVPAILHTGIGFVPNSLLITNSQPNAEMLQATKEALENSIKQLQLNLQNGRYQASNGGSNVDNIGGASSNVNSLNNINDQVQKAQLPIVGAKHVEILNPNFNGNAYAIQSIPAALVTTPIPILTTTTSFITPKQTFSSAFPDSSNLNLVSLVPGGNFYKHSQGAQFDLNTKPKLSSDLEKYAEEMFKESLRTIYNSHKWNNDYRYPINISLVDTSELAKLRNELMRLKQNYRGSKIPKDILEAHHTEQKIRASKPVKGVKRPTKVINTSIEQVYKKPLKGVVGSSSQHSTSYVSEILDFLTPPKINSFLSKSPFNEKPHKKRPGSASRVSSDNNKIRPRQGLVAMKPKGIDTQASALIHYGYPVRVYSQKKIFSQPDHTQSQFYNYPSFTTLTPSNDQFKASVEYKSSERDYLDMNNQRMHNLMGLLMKNKQLPSGTSNNYRNEELKTDQINSGELKKPSFDNFNDNIRGFQKKADFERLIIPLDRTAENNSTTT